MKNKRKISDFIKKNLSNKLRLTKPNARFKLDRNTSDKRILNLDREAEKEISPKLHEKLWVLQRLLYAGNQHKILIVLQGMDTAGKDGVIQHVFKGVNPQGVNVFSFKAPSRSELDHDYLWRIHQRVPEKGKITIFNRSHYEDVLVPRIHRLVSPEIWKRRYQHINDFERLLSDEGTIILKFFLHISKEEQRERLKARLKDPDKNWKYNSDDLKERKLWPQYMKAYEEAIGKTSTAWAPWHVIPSNKKWYRNLTVLAIIISCLEKLGMRYPEAEKGIKKVRIS